MNIIRPKLPDFDLTAWRALPFPERARAICTAWATDGYGTPVAIFGLYALKIAFYVWAWGAFCSLSPTLGGWDTVGQWWLEPLALQKAILWSMLFEVLGLGCGSGPLTARYMPPVAAPLHFLRRGTVRLPPIPDLPGFGGSRRTAADVALYAALLLSLLAALVSPVVATAHLVAIFLAAAVAGLRDRTIFLAARGEHYVVAVLIYLVAGSTGAVEATAGLMALWGALWFFAGFSKLNHHFPAVVCVMMSNSPVMRSVGLRKRLYRSFPDDLRPSQTAAVLGHFGTGLELAVAATMLAASISGSFPLLVVGMLLMLALHTYITSNVPMGVPLEWNVMVVYGAFALFWAHPDISVLQAGAAGGLVLATSVAVPLLGNLLPDRISFLPSMRYYAGNWAMSVWLFKDHSHEKLAALPTAAAWVEDQLGILYDEETITGLVGKVMAFRLMHLHGRALGLLLPKAIDAPLARYTWVDGELVAGMVLGWNFGDGHLHGEALIEAIREQCGFEPGELRCICVESQPLLRRGHAYKIFDGADGLIEEGSVDIATLRARQPWDLGEIAG